MTTSAKTKKTSQPTRYFVLRGMSRRLRTKLAEEFAPEIMDVTPDGFTIALPARAYGDVSFMKEVIEDNGNPPCVAGVYTKRPVVAA